MKRTEARGVRRLPTAEADGEGSGGGQAVAARYDAKTLARRYKALYDALLTSTPSERAVALARATR